jgi:uncharacterized protein (TIGR02300 family)
MSPAKKTAKKKSTAKKAPARKPAPKKAAKKPSAAPRGSGRRGPAPKSLQRRTAAAAGEKKMQKAKSAGAPAAARRASDKGRAAAARQPAAAASGLGTKYTCFRCGAKFYDLNRPKALCPKCGADQREAPKVAPKARQALPVKPLEPEVDRERERGREQRRMGPLLDEDDEEIIIEDEPEDLELALEVVEDEEFLEGDDEEPEEES